MVRTLPNEKVRCIESLLRMGKPYREVARECDVSVTTVVKYGRGLRARTQQSSAEGNEGVGEEDVEALMRLMRERLDPKHPALTKLVVDTSWWFHVILDFGKFAIPELMGYMGANEIDTRNPEATARALVGKLKQLKALAEERGEELKALEGRVKELEEELGRVKEENEQLRELVSKYRELIDEALEKAEASLNDLRGRVAETLEFIIKHVPRALPREARQVYYHIVIPKVREVWGR